MFESPDNRAEVVDFALLTARKIEAESRNHPPNMRRLAMLSSTYDSCASKAAKLPLPSSSLPYPETDELFPLGEDLALPKQLSSRVTSSSAIDDSSPIDESAIGNSSAIDGSCVTDDFHSSDSSNDSNSPEDVAPPPYTLQPTSSEVIVSASGCLSRADLDDNSTLLDHIAASFNSRDFHSAGKSRSSGSNIIEHIEKTRCVGSGMTTEGVRTCMPLQWRRSPGRGKSPMRPPLVRGGEYRTVAGVDGF